jgi:uncharacterized protein
VLRPQERAVIEGYLATVERGVQTQFAVVTIQSLEGEPIENVATDLYNRWGVGKADNDEGLLYLLAIQDRRQRVEAGYGTEAYITDGFAGDVLRSVRPLLRQENYAGAIDSAVRQLANRIAEGKGVTIEGRAAPPRPRVVEDPPSLGELVGGLIALLFVLSLLGAGRRRGGRLSGGQMLAAFLLGQMLSGGRRRGGWSHGGFGGFDSGGFGGGGFGGFGGFGGGSSGGGGASGNW